MSLYLSGKIIDFLFEVFYVSLEVIFFFISLFFFDLFQLIGQQCQIFYFLVKALFFHFLPTFLLNDLKYLMRHTSVRWVIFHINPYVVGHITRYLLPSPGEKTKLHLMSTHIKDTVWKRRQHVIN